MTDTSPETGSVDCEDQGSQSETLAEILSSMTSGSPPVLSPLKETPKKRAWDDLTSTPPSAQPCKRQKTECKDFQTYSRRHFVARTAAAKANSAIENLGKHLANRTCPPGLQYRPKILCRTTDARFKKGLEAITREVEQKTVSLLIEFHRRCSAEHERTQLEIEQELCSSSDSESQRQRVRSRLLQKSTKQNKRSSNKGKAKSVKSDFIRKADLKDVLSQILSEMNVNTFASANKRQCETYKSVSL